jgi:thiosulfate reductase cytochrome b subunit
MIDVSAIMTGSSIRILICGAGVAIITFFTQINKSWYIFYIGIYYILFMAVDTGLALWMAAYCRRDDDN